MQLEQISSRNQTAYPRRGRISRLSHLCNWLVGISDNDNMMDWQDFIFLQDWKILIPLGNKCELFTEKRFGSYHAVCCTWVYGILYTIILHYTCMDKMNRTASRILLYWKIFPRLTIHLNTMGVLIWLFYWVLVGFFIQLKLTEGRKICNCLAGQVKMDKEASGLPNMPTRPTK